MWGSPSGAGRQSGHGRLLSPRGSGGTEVVVPQSTRPSCRLDISREEALHGVAISSITSAAWGKGPLGEGRKQTPRVRVAQGDCCGCQPAHPLPLRGCSGCTEQSQGPAGAAAGPGVLRAAPPAGLAAGPKWPGVGLGYWQGRCCQVVLEGARLGSGFCFVGDSEGCAWCLTGKGAPRQSWHWAGIPRGARWPQGHPCPGRLTTDWRPQGRGLGGHLGLPSVIDPCGPLKGSPPHPCLGCWAITVWLHGKPGPRVSGEWLVPSLHGRETAQSVWVAEQVALLGVHGAGLGGQRQQVPRAAVVTSSPLTWYCLLTWARCIQVEPERGWGGRDGHSSPCGRPSQGPRAFLRVLVPPRCVLTTLS